MANLVQSITTGLAELKNYYQGPLKSQFNDDVPVYRGAEKIKQGWSGYQVVRPLKTKRNQGIGAIADAGVLPSSGYQTTVQALIQAKFNYLVFAVTGPMIKASASDVGSFVRSASYELEQGYVDLKSDLNRQLSWNGNGALATVSAAASGTNVISVTGRESTEAADKFLDIGLVVDIWDATFTTQKASGVTINSMTTTGQPATSASLTLSSAVTVAATDILVRWNSYGNEIQGLLYALDGGTSTIYNIDRSVSRQYQGNAINNLGAQLSLDKMQFAWNEGKRRGGAKYSAIYCDFDSQRYYQKLLTADKRYTNTVKGDGGFASAEESFLEFNSIPIVADKDCPTRLFFLDESALKAYVLAEMEFADETGSMYIAKASQDALEVRVRMFMNLFNEKPSACSVLRNYISP